MTSIPDMRAVRALFQVNGLLVGLHASLGCLFMSTLWLLFSIFSTLSAAQFSNCTWNMQTAWLLGGCTGIHQHPWGVVSSHPMDMETACIWNSIFASPATLSFVFSLTASTKAECVFINFLLMFSDSTHLACRLPAYLSIYNFMLIATSRSNTCSSLALVVRLKTTLMGTGVQDLHLGFTDKCNHGYCTLYYCGLPVFLWWGRVQLYHLLQDNMVLDVYYKKGERLKSVIPLKSWDKKAQLSALWFHPVEAG